MLTDTPVRDVLAPLSSTLFYGGTLVMFWLIFRENGPGFRWILLLIVPIALLHFLVFSTWVVHTIRNVHTLRVVFDRQRALVTRVERYPWLRHSRIQQIPLSEVRGVQILTETEVSDGVPCHTLLLALDHDPPLRLQAGPPSPRHPRRTADRINAFLHGEGATGMRKRPRS